MKFKKEKVNELLYWSYANLAMAHSGVVKGQQKYSGVNFMIRSRLYKGLINGTMNIGTMFDDEKIKLNNANRCCYCGEKVKLSIDHLIPRILGGVDCSDNLVYACKTCNSSKGKKDLMEWMDSKGKFPSLMILRRYLKLVISYCEDKGLMSARLDDIDRKSLPFRLEYIPVDFPQPGQLVMVVTD